MDVSRITGEEAGTLTEVLAESPNKGLGPATLTMHSLHWAGHAGKGVRRAVRHPTSVPLITQPTGLRNTLNNPSLLHTFPST